MVVHHLYPDTLACQARDWGPITLEYSLLVLPFWGQYTGVYCLVCMAHRGARLRASQRGVERLRQDVLPACPHELAGICLYKRVKAWAEICLYERAGVQLAKETGILGPVCLGGLAPRCPGIALYKLGGVRAEICLCKWAGVWAVKEPSISGSIRPGGLV